MDRVTGSPPREAVDPHDPPSVERDDFEAPPQAVPLRRTDRRRAIAAIGAIAIVTAAGALAAVAANAPPAADPSRSTTRVAGRPVAPGAAARRVISVAPIGQLTTPVAIASARTVAAIPGCRITLQLGARQPRHIVQCPEVLPEDLGRMLVVRPRQTLRFEVPGWRVQLAARGAVVAPERPGMWTVVIPACLSRGGDWVCATWYATIDVRE